MIDDTLGVLKINQFSFVYELLAITTQHLKNFNANVAVKREYLESVLHKYA